MSVINRFHYQIILFVVLGFLAGISGGIVIFNFILNKTLTLPETTATLSRPVDNITDAPAKLGREWQQVIVEFYKNKPKSNLLASNVFLESEFLGYGTVLTADGWILTHQNVFATVPLASAVIMHNGRVMENQKVTRDKATGLVFIKTNIKNVPSVKLGKAFEVPAGEIVVVGGARGNFKHTQLIDGRKEFYVKEREVIHKSEDLYRLLVLGEEGGIASLGSPILTKGGELVGVVRQKEPEIIATPVQYIEEIKELVFKGQIISRPYLGVTYIDLPKNFVRDGATIPKTGALVVTDARFNAYGVATQSPAAKAGIKPGDILTAINDEEINQLHNLSDLLLQYREGNMIEVKLWRNNELLTVKVELMERPAVF